jgi:hypothetical protein
LKHRGRLLGAALAALAIGVGAVSCQVVAGLDGNFRAAPVGTGGAGDAGAPEAGPAGCQSATYAGPPGGVDDGTTIGPVVVAVHTVNLGDMGTIPGFDLDNVCTCTDDAGPSCAGRSAQAGLYCDAPGGIDNQFAKIVQLIQVPLGAATFSSTAFSNEANAGNWTLLVEIDGYNGMKDDPSVTVSLFPCPGLGVTPKWDGTDSWAVLDTDVDSAGMPVFTSDGAYVSGGTLVASVPGVPITLAGAKETITLTLSSAVLTGQLGQTNGQWRLEQGVLAARLGITNFFQSLSAYRDNQGLPLCTNSGLIYMTAKTSICNDADILLTATDPSSTTCDAVSFGMGFTADPAQRGPSVPAPTPTPGCSPATDPANDSCGSP